ncbi:MULTISPECIES: serine hydrolase domain-containing protein [Bacteria]|uniref:serine hydrolase domain-containing protein n=1 Tax=Bacteria TaxID=2 RepID=UPI003C7E8790
MRRFPFAATIAVLLAAGTAVAPFAAADTAVEPLPSPRAHTAASVSAEDRLVQEYADVYTTPGVAAAVIHDDIVTTSVRGRDANGDAVTPRTPFRIGSMSKSMTAAAVMLLVQENALTLDDRVVDRLPEFRMADPRSRDISVRQFLSHTSGLSITTNDEYALPIPDTLRATVAELRDRRLAAAPGTRFEYHNTNYALAARVVEAVSGTGFDDFLRERLFLPLGMGDTVSTVRCTDAVSGLASGHTVLLRAAVPFPEMPGRCGGNGGVVSTLDDMVRWMRFTAGDVGADVLDPELRVQMQKPQPVAAPYALGWEARPAGDGFAAPLLIHGGTLATYAGSMALAQDTGTAAIVLANGPGSPGSLAQNLIAQTDGHPRVSFDDPLTVANMIMLAIAIMLLVLFVTLFYRAKRWAARRNVSARPRILLRSVPLLVAFAGGLLVPLLPGLLGGMLLWEYWVIDLWLYPFLVLIALVLICGSSVVLARRLFLLRKGRPAVASFDAPVTA